MNKRIFFLILYFLIPFLIIPPVLAGTTTTVVYPNGGEAFFGTETIRWIATSTENSQDLNALIYYSFTTGGAQIPNQLIDDVNAFDYCDFTRRNLYWKADSDFNIGLNLNSFPVETDSVGYGSFWMDSADKLHFIVISHDSGAPRRRTITAFTHNTVTDWDLNSDINAGLETYNPDVAGRLGKLEIFEKDGDTLMIAYNNIKSGGNAGNKTHGYRWNNANKNWEFYPDINAGLPTTLSQEFSVINKTMANKDWWLLDCPNAKSYYYESNTWNENNYLIDNCSSTGFGQDMFLLNDVLYVVEGGYTPIPVYPKFQRLTDGLWENITTDINGGISYSDNPQHGVSYLPSSVSGRSNDYLLIQNHTGLGSKSIILYELLQGGYASNITANCRIEWDTTTVENGSKYFIDVNMLDTELDVSSVDTSDAKFSILNWTDQDISCECITNCSSCTLDVNAFIVIPSNENNDVAIKVTNGVGAKLVGYKTKNANNSGNQYRIKTADSDDYSAGIWNLSDTLTFGSTNYDSVQKIWDFGEEKYIYFFDDTIDGNGVIYYKMEYYQPAYHFPTVSVPVWDNQLPPSTSDINGLQTDLFIVSTYSDMDSFLTEPDFPSISSDKANTSYVFQFTVKGDGVFTELNAGGVELRSLTPSTSLELQPTYKTLAVTGLTDYAKIESSATTAREISIQNYVITERGYFTKPMKILDSDGSELPAMVGDDNKSLRYIIEGKDFRVQSQFYDPDDKIDKYEITAYISDVLAANKVKRWTFDSDDDELVNINAIVGGLVDLTANAPDRTIKLTLRLIDENAHYYEIQSDTITMRQYPTDTRDLVFRVSQGDQLIGENPKGRIWLETLAPENIIGVELNFQDSIDNNNADFNITFYKNVDFSCIAFDCSFDYEIKEYVFPSADNYRVNAWVLVATEEKTFATPFNDLLHDFKSFLVSWIVFDTARIFQTIERSDRTYRNDEVIPLVVQLRDSTGMPKTLKDRINITMSLSECAGDWPCMGIDLNYKPNSVFFDEATGYTYYHFRQVFVEGDYTPLSDGNSFRVVATISDPTKTHQTLYRPVLADKCQVVDPLVYFANMLTMDFFSWGCNSGDFTDLIVALPDNNTDEVKLVIDEDHSVTAPKQFWWQCTSPDQNNLYSNILAQDILCFSWYSIGESPIDEFKFYLTNKNSDLSQTDPELKQYVEISVPYEYIYFNDMQMLREMLKQEFSTDWTSTNPPSVGEIIQYQVQHFAGTLFPRIQIDSGSLFATGLIGNIGFDMGGVSSGNTVDFNFATPFDPRAVSGFITYRIRGINVINKKDFEVRYPELKAIDPSKFTVWADLENVRLRTDPINIDVFVSDNVKVLSVESNAKLVIDEESRAVRINTENLDENAGITTNYEFLPTKITFRAISDMIYNNKLTFDRRYLILPFTLVLEPETKCGLLGIGCWWNDDSGSIVAVVTEGDLSFFTKNWFLIMMAMVGVLFLSVIIGNIKKGQGVNISFPFRRRE